MYRNPMVKTLAMAAIAALALTAPGMADEDWDAGVAAYKAKKYAEAAAAFAKYVEKVDTAYQGHQMLGVSLLNSGQAAKAATHLSRANELKPNTAQIQLPLGQALLAAGRARDACGVLGSINEGGLAGGLQTSLYQLRAKANCGGNSLGDLKKVAEAKNTGETWAAYGVAALNDNRVSEAIGALDRAVRLSPNDARIRKSHVSALVRQARTARGAQKDATYNKAIDSAKRYSELDKKFSSRLTYGEVLLGAKKYTEAITVLQQAAQMSGSEWLPNFYLGQAYTSLDRFDAAEAPLKKALGQTSKAEDQKMINRQLGFTYEKMKDYGQAISYYQRAGDSAGVARVEENQKISEENAAADEFNRERERLLAEQERLKKELEQVPSSGPPPRR